MLFVELIFTFVATAILPDVASKSMHDSVLERTLEVATVGPFENSFTAHLVLVPSAGVLAAVSPEVDTFSLFDSILKESVVIGTIAPDFDSLSILALVSSDIGLRFDSI